MNELEIEAIKTGLSFLVSSLSSLASVPNHPVANTISTLLTPVLSIGQQLLESHIDSLKE